MLKKFTYGGGAFWSLHSNKNEGVFCGLHGENVGLLIESPFIYEDLTPKSKRKKYQLNLQS